jgi:hypothetical protein
LDYFGDLRPLKINSGKDYFEDSYGPETLNIYNINKQKMEYISEIIETISNPKEYNKFVEEYNNTLYENRKIKFDIYE